MSKYAIAFDLETSSLESSYHNDSWRNAYSDIRKVLEDEYGFEKIQQTVYFSVGDISPVECVLAVQELERRFLWFAPSVKDIRMLRIEETSDLKPAIGFTNKRKSKAG